MLVFAALSLTNSVHAQDIRSCTSAPARDSAYCYAVDVVEALARGPVAVISSADSTPGERTPISEASDVLFASGRQRTGIAEALDLMRRHRTSKDSLIRSSAQGLSNGLVGMRGFLLGSDSLVRAVLDERAGSLGAAAQRMADLRNLRHTSASLLMMSTAEVTYALLEPIRDTQKMRLAMTAAELL